MLYMFTNDNFSLSFISSNLIGQKITYFQTISKKQEKQDLENSYLGFKIGVWLKDLNDAIRS